MLRKIIKIDQNKCNGCGLCVTACHEGAIALQSGKAVLIRDDYCDGLGNCLPVCPTRAICFEEREALEYNESEVIKNINMNSKSENSCLSECPGSLAKMIDSHTPSNDGGTRHFMFSRLRQWPAQIKLVPIRAPYFDNADILVSADCSAYAYGGFHDEFMRGKITLIGCPKLDAQDYSEKLAAIISANNIVSLTVARMEVPCCGGIETAAKTALEKCGKAIPLQIMTISIDGKIISQKNFQ